jgi:hypothetical protein
MKTTTAPAQNFAAKLADFHRREEAELLKLQAQLEARLQDVRKTEAELEAQALNPLDLRKVQSRQLMFKMLAREKLRIEEELFRVKVRLGELKIKATRKQTTSKLEVEDQVEEDD